MPCLALNGSRAKANEAKPSLITIFPLLHASFREPRRARHSSTFRDRSKRFRMDHTRSYSYRLTPRFWFRSTQLLAIVTTHINHRSHFSSSMSFLQSCYHRRPALSRYGICTLPCKSSCLLLNCPMLWIVLGHLYVGKLGFTAQNAFSRPPSRFYPIGGYVWARFPNLWFQGDAYSHTYVYCAVEYAHEWSSVTPLPQQRQVQLLLYKWCSFIPSRYRHPASTSLSSPS